MDTLPLPLHFADEDSELETVVAALLAEDPDGTRFAGTFRRSIDMLLDGRNTGRFRWDQLHKTEKTHAGTLVEINLQREFHFADGEKMDYKIHGVDVDCKFSQDFGRWMIPPEAMGHLCLVTWCEDAKSRWSVGLVRITADRLSDGRNRDNKRSLNPLGRSATRWLFRDAQLPENALLSMSADDIDAIFADRDSGQQRVNELFRRSLGRRVSRAVVATVAQQDDYMKRVRAYGGARTALAPEGIVIFGQYRNHVALAGKLGLPLPGPGESVSARLTRWDVKDGDVPRAEIDGTIWRVARPDDAPCQAPTLPGR